MSKLNGVSSNIMMGQIPPGGTGATELFVDESKLLELYFTPEKEISDINLGRSRLL